MPISPTITQDAKFTTATSSPVGVVAPLRIGHRILDTTNGKEYIAIGVGVNDWIEAGQSLPANISTEPRLIVGATQATMDAASSAINFRYVTPKIAYFYGRVRATAWTSTGNLSIADFFPENVSSAAPICDLYNIAGWDLTTPIALVTGVGSTTITLRNRTTHAQITHAVLDASPATIDMYVDHGVVQFA